MMKALRPALTAGECRDILQKTSYDIPEQGSQWYEPGGCGRVADIDRALHDLPTLRDVEAAFHDVQLETGCSTGCGRCHDRIMDIISQMMYGMVQ